MENVITPNNASAKVAEAKPTIELIEPTAYNRPPLWRASLPGREPVEFRAWATGAADEFQTRARDLFAR